MSDSKVQQATTQGDLTDEQIDTIVCNSCHSDPHMANGEYCLTKDEVRAILAAHPVQPAGADCLLNFVKEVSIGAYAYEELSDKAAQTLKRAQAALAQPVVVSDTVSIADYEEALIDLRAFGRKLVAEIELQETQYVPPSVGVDDALAKVDELGTIGAMKWLYSQLTPRSWQSPTAPVAGSDASFAASIRKMFNLPKFSDDRLPKEFPEYYQVWKDALASAQPMDSGDLRDAVRPELLRTLKNTRQWHQGDEWRKSSDEHELTAWQLHMNEIDHAIAMLSQPTEHPPCEGVQTKLDRFLSMVKLWVERDGGDMDAALSWMYSAQNTWQPIETAPKDNERLLYLAFFDDKGELQKIDFDGIWKSESESWEMPEVYYFWASAGGMEEPTHWAFQDEPIPAVPQPVQKPVALVNSWPCHGKFNFEVTQYGIENLQEGEGIELFAAHLSLSQQADEEVKP